MKQETNLHARARALIFQAKAMLLRVRRGTANFSGGQIRQFSFAQQLADRAVIAESKTPLWTDSATAENFLLAGKIHNLRLAAEKLHGLEIPANEIFSFWKHVGRASRFNGYVAGRELREGCLIPSVGGGLCQLSNALYDAALRADFEIVERHAHSQIVAGSLAEQGRDATVFWNYIDLRFKSPTAFRIEAQMDKDYLFVKFKSANKSSKKSQIGRSKVSAEQNLKSKSENPNSCASCGAGDCFRSLKPAANIAFGRTAFLVDEYSPEFDEYLQKTRTTNDVLFVPLDGKHFRQANYAWNRDGFAATKQSLLVAVERSYKSRRLAAQGAARQLNLLTMYRKLAENYVKSLRYDMTRLVVQQNLLPFLWQSGVLGGRGFDVLMTSLPLEKLQEKLDFAASMHRESATLGDFRAAKNLIAAETEALRNADKIITPHTAIAALFPDRAELLNWKIPAARPIFRTVNDKYTVVFPASTVGRKGCFELREAVRGLNVRIIGLGANLESADFWRGFDFEIGSETWLESADLVVLPAHVEHKPRRLLQAVANGIPVVASKNCGLESIKTVITIEAGDARIPRTLIGEFMSKKKKNK